MELKPHEIFTLEDLPNERWKVITTFPEYMISDYGRVKSLEKIKNIPVHNVPFTMPSAIRRSYKHKYGYRLIDLSMGGVKKKLSVHYLVATYFVDNPNNLPHVMHLDDISDNNYYTNLKWGSVQDNMDLKVKANRQRTGEGVPSSKLTEEIVLEIRLLKAKGMKSKDIAPMFDISRPTVSEIINRKTWKHI